MEQEPPQEERECDEYAEEVDSSESSLQNSAGSDRQMEEEEEEEEEEEGLSDEPTGEPAYGAHG